MEQLYPLLEIAATRRRFTSSEKEAADLLFDQIPALLQTRRNPPGFRFVTGEIATGATGRIALNAYFQLLGRIALGPDYAWKDERFTRWHLELGFGIMHGHFTRDLEKGFYCCPTCTISVFPLYCVKAFKRFDNDLLKKNMFEAITGRSGRFATHFSQKYANWALQFS